MTSTATPNRHPAASIIFMPAPTGGAIWRASLRDGPAAQSKREAVETAFAELSSRKNFMPFLAAGSWPRSATGSMLTGILAQAFAALARRISAAVVTGDYKHDLANGRPMMPATFRRTSSPDAWEATPRRPYFEVLVVTPLPIARWPHLVSELRRLRRTEDEFIYEVVPVGSFEDAVCAAILNPDLAAVAHLRRIPASLPSRRAGTSRTALVARGV